MSNIKLLLDVVDDMHRLADSLKTVADSIGRNTPDGDSIPEKHTTPVVSIEQVRALLAEKSSAGRSAEVKSLLFKYDAGKLSGVKPEDYAALMEEAAKL